MNIENGINRDSESGENAWMSEPVERDDEFKSGFPEININIEIETANETSEFTGEDNEVTVERSARDGQPKRLEGGWQVMDVRDGKVLVSDSDGNGKTIDKEKLLKMQPFQKGDTVTVMRSHGILQLDWKIAEHLPNGDFKVVKNEIGENMTKILKKHELVMTKIFELETKRNVDPADMEKNAENRKYWKSKVKTIEKINSEQKERLEE